MPYQIFKEDNEYFVWKVDDQKHKVERKNKTGEKSHAAALAYLRALYSAESRASASFESEPIGITASEALILGSVHLESDAENPRFMRFHDAVLARAETNANRDELDEEGIKQLASSIAGCPIDLEHDPRKNLGFYTAGRAEGGALKVDGVVWLDRCDALGVNASQIEDGTYKLSIEAEASTAECSVCNTVHSDAASYCQHLKAKAVYGARRILKGLKAVGGALTLKPAGTSTTFSTIYMVASHQEEEMSDETTLADVVEKLESIEAAISKREDVTPADKKRAESEYGDVEYADEKNKKYPLDKEHIHAAWSYINMPKNAAKYSSEELAAMKSKIKRAAKKFGMEIADGEDKNKSKSSVKETAMAAEDKEKETPEEDKQESAQDEKNETEGGTTPAMTADDYAAMSKKVSDMASELEGAKADTLKAQSEKTSVEAKLKDLEAQVLTLQASLGEARATIRASQVAALKAKIVGSVLTEDDFEAQKDTLIDLPEAVLDVLIKANQRGETSESTEAGSAGNNRVMASEKVPDNGKVKLTL